MNKTSLLQLKKSIAPTDKGFSLIELMVAVAIFAIVMLVATGSVLTMVEANRKAQSLKSVMNNLNFALEHMARNIRVGTVYHCKSGAANPPPVTGNIDTPSDCVNGGNLFAFEAADGNSADPNDQIIYRINGTHIERSTAGQATVDSDFIPITAPEVEITRFSFYVTGTGSGDNLQPRAIMVLEGTAGTSTKTVSDFTIQTTITQRILDL